MINNLSWLFAGPLPESIKRYAAIVLVLLAAVIILPSPKNIHTWKIYGWLFCLAGAVASLLLFGSFVEAARILIRRLASMTKKAAGIIQRIIYRGPKDWEDDMHEYGV